MKKYINSSFLKSSLFLLLIAVLFFSGTKISEASSNNYFINKLVIESDEIVDRNLYTSAQEITVDGLISGDLIAVANKIIINGELSGDLIAVASIIEINGRVNGNLRTVSENLRINGLVQKNVTALSSNIITGPDSIVGWDFVSLSSSLELNGIINDYLKASAQNIKISGKVDKDVDLNLKTKDSFLFILSEAEIKGNLNYVRSEYFQSEINGLISGSVNESIKETKNYFNFSTWLLKTLFLIISAFLVGLVIIYLFKNTAQELIFEKSKYLLKDFVFGLIFAILVPIASILLFISIIGIPLSLISLSLYLILIYLGKIVSAIFIGSLIFKIFKKEVLPIWKLLVGVILCWLIFSLPFVGAVLSGIASILGIGMLIIYVKNKSRNI